MPIVYNTSQRIHNIGTPGTTVSASYTMGTGANGLLVVFVTYSAGVVNSVTYGGVALTYTGITASNGVPLVCYTLINPPTGANTLTVITSASSTTLIDAISYTGVQVYGVIDGSSVSNSVTGASPAVTTYRTQADQSWVIGWCRCSGTATLSGSGFTQRQAANNIILADTNGPLTRATLATFTTTYSGGFTGHIVLGIRPAGVSGGIMALL